MVVVIYGTTGELIKLMPLLKTMKREDYVAVCTYQQPQQLRKLFKDAVIDTPDYKIGQNENDHDLENLRSVPLWFIKLWFGFFKNRSRIIKRLRTSGDERHVVMVHGDTTSTLLGCVMGKFLRLPVCHIEAGLRSYNWRHPFPEELNRIYTSKLARLHFAPGDSPVSNLKRANTKGEIINTRYNTVLDSLRLARDGKSTIEHNIPKKYGLVSIHRNELLAQPKELKAILRRLNTFADTLPLIFLDHPITKERIHGLGYDALLERPNITRLPKLSYFNFINLLTKAECAITDSGGLQEETAYLGIPCLVHRKATEREEGLGKNVVLSLYDAQIVDTFCSGYGAYRTAEVGKNISPSQTILTTLKRNKYLSAE